MKESIYTIPISEIFEEKCGCPICKLYNTLENRWVEYITGAAMMEPDIRIETNRQGFCLLHFEMMNKMQKKLPVGLVIQSHLGHIEKTLTELKPQKKPMFGEKTRQREKASCFVCERIDQEFYRIGDNIVAFWIRETDFRELYREQEFLCYPHFQLLAQAGVNNLKGKLKDEFIEATAHLTRKKLQWLKGNIDSFCNLFDYRSSSSGPAPEEVSGAINNAVAYLTGNTYKAE